MAKRTCPMCKGRQNCQECYGLGVVRCPDCEGLGCRECAFDGNVVCITCEGRGVCPRCHGYGVLASLDRIVW